MTAIAAARRASTAARATAKETSAAQTNLDVAQANIKSFDGQAKAMKSSLNLELQKSPPNPVTVKALRDAVANFEGLRDAEKQKLPELKQAVQDSLKKQSSASAAAFKEERKILDTKEQLQKDQFSAKSSAEGKRTAAKALDAGGDALDALEKSLRAKLRQPNLSAAEKREIRHAIAALDKGEAALHGADRKLQRSAKKDDAKARQLDRKLDAFEPVAKEAEQLLTKDATDFVTLTGGSVTTQVKAAVTEAEEKANGAGSTQQLDTVMNSKNADRAMNAWERIDRVANASTDAKARLTPEIREALVQGVALSRTGDDLGQEGILTQRQAEKAAKALAEMPKERYEAIAKQLANAGGATGDAQTERALILKAVAARADKLTNTSTLPFSKVNSNYALAEVNAFANEIRGEQKDKLIASTSPIDLDGSKNDSTVDPRDVKAGNDNTLNNDGRYQKFETTCAPTTSQIVREEADPIAARRMSKDGVANADPTGNAATQQKDVLKSHGSSTSSRRASQAYERAIEVGKKIPLSPMEMVGLQEALRGNPHAYGIWVDGAAVLKKVQAADGGMPGATELGWMKTELARDAGGMATVDALNDIASRSVGYDYKQVGVGGSVTASWTDNKNVARTTTMSVPNAADFAIWDTRLKEGHDVPLRITDSGGKGGHAITITDVRDRPDRQYLVSDPYSGRTAWVKQSDIANGLDANGNSWINQKFGWLGWDRISDFFVEK